MPRPSEGPPAASAPRPLVSALIVSYNVRDLLLECIRAFYSSSDVPVEAVVVDNASADGSAEAVEKNFPQAKVVRMPRNAGYGAASNAGLHACRGRFILLLNPDVTVGAGAVGALSDHLLVRPDAGAVGPRIRRPDGTLDLASRRGFPTPATAFYRTTGLGRLFPHSGRFNRYNMGHVAEGAVHEIDSGTGACLMVRRAAVEKIGLFDPAFFMYGEDLDLCYRLKENGWKVFYLPAATAIHVKGAATRQRTQRMLYEFHRAMWTFHAKHYADGLPAFLNGIIWAGIWGRWLALSARARLTGDARVSA